MLAQEQIVRFGHRANVTVVRVLTADQDDVTVGVVAMGEVPVGEAAVGAAVDDDVIAMMCDIVFECGVEGGVAETVLVEEAGVRDAAAVELGCAFRREIRVEVRDAEGVVALGAE